MGTTDPIKFIKGNNGAYTLTKTKDGKTATVTVIDTDKDGLDKNDSVSVTGDVSIFSAKEIKDAINAGAEGKKYDDKDARTQDQLKSYNLSEVKVENNVINFGTKTLRLGSLMSNLGNNDVKFQTEPKPETTTPANIGDGYVNNSIMREAYTFGNKQTRTANSSEPALLNGIRTYMNTGDMSTLSLADGNAVDRLIGNFLSFKGTVKFSSSPIVTTNPEITVDDGSKSDPTTDGADGSNGSNDNDDAVKNTTPHSIKTDSITLTRYGDSKPQVGDKFDIKVDLRHEKTMDGTGHLTLHHGLKEQINKLIDQYYKDTKISALKAERTLATIARLKYKLDSLEKKREYADKEEKFEIIKRNLIKFTLVDPNDPKSYDGVSKDVKIKISINGKLQEVDIVGLKKAINADIEEYVNPKTSAERRFQLACSIAQLKSRYEDLKPHTEKSKKGNETTTTEVQNKKLEKILKDNAEQITYLVGQIHNKKDINKNKKALEDLGLTKGEINTLLAFKGKEVLKRRAYEFAELGYKNIVKDLTTTKFDKQIENFDDRMFKSIKLSSKIAKYPNVKTVYDLALKINLLVGDYCGYVRDGKKPPELTSEQKNELKKDIINLKQILIKELWVNGHKDYDFYNYRW